MATGPEEPQRGRMSMASDRVAQERAGKDYFAPTFSLYPMPLVNLHGDISKHAACKSYIALIMFAGLMGGIVAYYTFIPTVDQVTIENPTYAEYGEIPEEADEICKCQNAIQKHNGAPGAGPEGSDLPGWVSVSAAIDPLCADAIAMEDTANFSNAVMGKILGGIVSLCELGTSIRSEKGFLFDNDFLINPQLVSETNLLDIAAGYQAAYQRDVGSMFLVPFQVNGLLERVNNPQYGWLYNHERVHGDGVTVDWEAGSDAKLPLVSIKGGSCAAEDLAEGQEACMMFYEQDLPDTTQENYSQGWTSFSNGEKVCDCTSDPSCVGLAVMPVDMTCTDQPPPGCGWNIFKLYCSLSQTIFELPTNLLTNPTFWENEGVFRTPEQGGTQYATVGMAIQNAMAKNFSHTVSHEAYYNLCRPTTCTYIVKGKKSIVESLITALALGATVFALSRALTAAVYDKVVFNVPKRHKEHNLEVCERVGYGKGQVAPEPPKSLGDILRKPDV